MTDIYEQEMEIDRIILHPKYSPSNNHDYDVALVKLKTPMRYNRRVRPVCLPKVGTRLGPLLSVLVLIERVTMY